ncbi:MAG: hypothetical protein GWN53_11085, partial [Gammaproteobacteria bacterium]|nr:hypothetical protein [Gemmatimonadota bacterium]NIR75129.1 hypothetical protein [Candidatus Kutchimonas denitrificans]NIU52939.1 hypothetical protein [Gemmatimonadota bacterium]NIV52408.1 hypothetical protein [Gammaproteobacteria bacterium]NIY44828.1 hypothetical protein [Gemmatimonadota bacterium]
MRDSHVLRALVVYAGAAWAILEATDFFVDKFGLPGWFLTVVLVLLGAGLVSMVTTAVVQSQPAAQKRDVAGPTPWEVDLVDLKESVSRGRVPTLTWGRWALGGAVVFSLLFGFAGLYVLVTQRTPPPLVSEADAGPAIAVLPFRVVGADAELWREGMVDLFYSNLDGVAGLRAIDPSVVVSRWRAAAGEAADAGAADQALAVARGIGASYALLGNMVGSANAVRLTAEVHDLRTGATQRAQVEGTPDRVMSLVDELCMELLRGGLAGEAEGIPQLDLSRITTSSLPALVAYLEGEQLYRRSRFRESIPHYQAAVEEDSTFALALYRISRAYGWVDPYSEVTAEYSRRANRFTDRLPARERQLMRSDLALESFRLEAVELLEELSSRYPDDPE